MKTATLLFTYNRSYHTEQVINSLKQNTQFPSKLFVFQDGLKQGEDDYEWKKVNDIIRAIDWCENEIIVSSNNKGLAASIVSGINYAFEEYDTVIVIEDDCVCSVDFISFMQQCFEKYKDDKKVYSVSGYSYPVSLEKGKYDVYGCGRISSWGWGTWKDRWDIYEKDYELVKKMKQEKMTSASLAVWGRDLEEMLVGNVRGNSDSWAVFWALKVISREGVCINPYESLIKNIGLDGTGTHCGKTNQFDVEMINEGKRTFSLPDQIEFLRDTIETFVPLFGSYTAINQEGSKTRVLVYGLGNFFLQNEKVINEKYNIEAFIDQRKHGWFAGKKIIKADKINQYIYDKILIMIQDIQECRNVEKTLLAQGIDQEQILSGYKEYL